MAKPLISLCLFMLVQYLSFQSVASQTIVTNVPTSWKKIFEYNNHRNYYPVTRMSQWTIGLKTRTGGDSLVATEELGPGIGVGQQFEIQRLQFKFLDYKYSGHRHHRESMEQREIYQTRERRSRVTIPARTSLTKWQLVANVAGHEVGCDHSVDTYGDTIPYMHSRPINDGRGVCLVNPDDKGDDNDRDDHNDRGDDYNDRGDDDDDHEDDDNSHGDDYNDHGDSGDGEVQEHRYGHHHQDVSRATLVLSMPQQPILYGTTRVRIRHKDTNQYLTAGRWHLRMALATLNPSYGSQFILHNSSSGVKVQALNPAYRGHEWLTSDPSGQVHFTRSGRSLTQHWIISETRMLHDTDTVTLRSNRNNRGFLLYYNGQVMTRVYGIGDEWILEVAR